MGGGEPDWNTTGGELYFLSPVNRLIAVRFTVTADTDRDRRSWSAPARHGPTPMPWRRRRWRRSDRPPVRWSSQPAGLRLSNSELVAEFHSCPSRAPTRTVHERHSTARPIYEERTRTRWIP